MAYCAWCGVQVEPGHLSCPLCSGDLSEGERPTLPASQAFAREHEAVSSPEDLLKRRLGMAAAVLGAVLVPSALVCVLIDVIYGGQGWSRLVVALMMLAWGLGIAPRLFFRKPLVIGLVDVALVGLFLVAVDLMGPWQGWSLRLGIPILVAVALGVVLVWLALRRYRHQTGFVLATFLGVLVILCLVIDAAVSNYLTGQIELRWSLVTLATISPLILAAVILQIILPRSESLQRFLHW